MKKIIPYINAENELNESVIKKAIAYENNGADELFIYNYSGVEAEQEEFLQVVKDIVKKVDLPVMIGCFVRRFEDVKKASYTGAVKVVIPYCKLENKNVIQEAIERFGNEKITIEFDASEEKNDGMLRGTELLNQMKEYGVTSLLLKHITLSEAMVEKIEHTNMTIYVRDSLLRNDLESLLKVTNVTGVATDYLENKDIMRLKRILKEEGIETDTFESSIDFSDFKKDANGLVPVIVQDYKTKEVLMLAYMNEEAYNTTIATGKMTYYSRSRSELWIKGETSGHYQYVRSLYLDCDKDTILANVLQIGVACHTGSRSCFFRELMKKEYDDTNPLTVFQEVFDVILDRREHPKEGSYTNYLFDKGIDKILKKCGEEATEIVIAAKNPNAEELKYEISDFLYHMMVLMVQCGLDWDDVITELSHRR